MSQVKPSGTSGEIAILPGSSFVFFTPEHEAAMNAAFAAWYEEVREALNSVVTAFAELGESIAEAVGAGFEPLSRALPDGSEKHLPSCRRHPHRPDIRPVQFVDAVQAGRRMLYPRARRI